MSNAIHNLQAPISSLSSDLLNKIVIDLQCLQTVSRCAQTCKQFKKLIEETNIYKRLIEGHPSLILRLFDRIYDYDIPNLTLFNVLSIKQKPHFQLFHRLSKQCILNGKHALIVRLNQSNNKHFLPVLNVFIDDPDENIREKTLSIISTILQNNLSIDFYIQKLELYQSSKYSYKNFIDFKNVFFRRFISFIAIILFSLAISYFIQHPLHLKSLIFNYSTLVIGFDILFQNSLISFIPSLLHIKHYILYGNPINFIKLLLLPYAILEGLATLYGIINLFQIFQSTFEHSLMN